MPGGERGRRGPHLPISSPQFLPCCHSSTDGSWCCPLRHVLDHSNHGAAVQDPMRRFQRFLRFAITQPLFPEPPHPAWGCWGPEASSPSHGFGMDFWVSSQFMSPDTSSPPPTLNHGEVLWELWSLFAPATLWETSTPSKGFQ